MIRTLLSLALFVTLASCDSEAGRAGMVAGHWSQETASDKKGMTLEFDGNSDRMLVHTAPDEHGGHDHLEGSYTFDAASGTVTVRCELNGHGAGDSWSGKLEGDHLSLTAGANTLRFHRGDDPHSSK